jgi:hypothetical protein
MPTTGLGAPVARITTSCGDADALSTDFEPPGGFRYEPGGSSCVPRSGALHPWMQGSPVHWGCCANTPRQPHLGNGQLQRRMGRSEPPRRHDAAGHMPGLRRAAVGLPQCRGNALRPVRNRKPRRVMSSGVEPPNRAPLRPARAALRSRAEQIADQRAADGESPEPTVRRLPLAPPLPAQPRPGR